jgi:nucleoside-diphosphate-sugar epimerase
VYNLDAQSEANNLGLKESDAYPANPEDGYGWEKLFSERMCRHFFEDFGIETRVARFHNVYGPSGTWRGGREKAPAAICRKIAEAKLENRSFIEIWGDGFQSRSFTYIDDAIRGVQYLMNSDFRDPINIGSSELVNINTLVDMVEDIAKISPKLERRYDLTAPKGVRGRNSDNQLILKLFNWEPEVSLRHGLEKTFDWVYKENLSLQGRKL